jgi:hypothetical protein
MIKGCVLAFTFLRTLYTLIRTHAKGDCFTIPLAISSETVLHGPHVVYL